MEAHNQIVMLVGDHHIDRRVLDQARSLFNAGWKVAVIALFALPDEKLLTERAFPEIEVIRVSGERTERLFKEFPVNLIEEALSKLPKVNWVELFPHLVHFIFEAAARPATVYMANDLPQLPAAVIASMINKARLTYDAHELFGDQGFAPEKKKILDDIECELIQYADAVMTVNESIADIMAERYRIKKPTVILNCTSTHGKPVPMPKTDTIRQLTPVPRESRILLFQGNISEKTRNLENVIKGISLSKHKDVSLVLVGPEAHAGARVNLAAVGKSCGILGSRLFFIDAIPQSKLLDVTASADAAIVPYVAVDLNTALCTPNKLFEFLVAGVPVIGNDLTELRRFIGQEGVGINRSMNSADEIRDAIDEMFDLDLDKLRMHCATVAPRYVWEIQGQKVVELVDRVTGRASASAPNRALLSPVKDATLKVATIIGARPQFIKAAAVSKAFQEEGNIEEFIIHTGQHYDQNMSDVFFEELGIPTPSVTLEVGSGSHGAQTGLMLERIERSLEKIKPDVVLVYGDTNSTLAGSLAASKMQIPVAHVEAGLRAFTRFKPEEINRVLTDHNSDVLYPPNSQSFNQLIKEGLSPSKIMVVGDVMYDVALQMAEKSVAKHSLLASLGVQSKSFGLCSLHRPENTDDKARLELLIEVLAIISRRLPIILPLHPRTRSRLEQFGIALSYSNIRVIEPVGYLEMVLLEKEAKIILTDSGGVQKEAYFHSTPCVTLRDETEWTELLATGWNTLNPLTNIEKMVEVIDDVLSRDFNLLPKPSLYGCGDAGGLIARDLRARFARSADKLSGEAN